MIRGLRPRLVSRFRGKGAEKGKSGALLLRGAHDEESDDCDEQPRVQRHQKPNHRHKGGYPFSERGYSFSERLVEDSSDLSVASIDFSSALICAQTTSLRS